MTHASEIAACTDCSPVNSDVADRTMESVLIGTRDASAVFCAEHCSEMEQALDDDEPLYTSAGFALFAPLAFPIAAQAVSGNRHAEGIDAAVGMFIGGVFWTTVVLLAVFPVLQQAVFGALPF